MKRISLLALAAAIAVGVSAQIIYIDDSAKGQTSSATHFAPKGEATYALRPVAPSQVRMLPGLFADRYALNNRYLKQLEEPKLLQNFYAEAGLNKEYMVGKDQRLDDFYWGWESLSGQLRGHFLGHYLSACAYVWAQTADPEIKKKADFIVRELARCQQINGGEWVGSIPEKYLYLMAEGRPMWSPQYTLHKTLMGLYDMATVGQNPQALEILDRFADWFHRWTGEMIAKGNQAAIMNGETSGMLEIWANMYGLAKDNPKLNAQKYLDLMERYGQPWLFTQLMNGEEALSSDHANASIPWSHGAARCYEVTGDPYWLEVTQRFWDDAVNQRENFATGGQNAGEHWIPKGELAHFAGENNQEHCTVYNLMRTADYLYRWTGDPQYADYIERNLYNGILAQQHPHTGMVAYFLPMASGYRKGGEKGWGHPTMDFYCCHGSLVQAHNRYQQYIYFEGEGSLTVAQYIPSELTWSVDSTQVTVTQDFQGNQWNKAWDGDRFTVMIDVKAERPTTFALRLRLPWWLDKRATLTVDGKPVTVSDLHGYVTIDREWTDNKLILTLPDRLWTEPLPGAPGMVAFMEGPIVLAAETLEVPLKGDPAKPESMWRREMDQQYRTVRWQQSHYRSLGQDRLIRLKPLYEIADEAYTIYFPVGK